MSLEAELEQEILVQSEKLILRFQSYHNRLHQDHLRSIRRGGTPPPKQIRVPSYWNTDKKFNPFYVAKHAKSIARSVGHKLQTGSYRPLRPATWSLAKPNGGHRPITVFQIPDAAVSNILYRNLLAKNKHRFSSYSYAYRDDRNAHFAVQDIAVDVRYYSRLFICELDFSDFFGSINHDYLEAQFSRNGFLISPDDLNLIQVFLSYQTNRKGVPQGTSISLFLANLACWELDKSLEKEGVKFARYADDTIIWSSDYSKICKAFELISIFSNGAGISVNARKSEGISLLTRHGLNSEFYKVKNNIDFLGYSISVDSIGIRKTSIQRIKRRISYLIYRNLIQPLNSSQLRSVIVPANNLDRSFLSCVMQVRRYLYGNLSESQLYRYSVGHARRLRFKGLMSYYPLLENERQLRELDGWLRSTFDKALRLRARLFLQHGHDVQNQFPFNSTGNQLLQHCRQQVVFGRRLYKIPSFLRIYQAIRRGVLSGGIIEIMNPRTRRYPSDMP